MPGLTRWAIFGACSLRLDEAESTTVNTLAYYPIVFYKFVSNISALVNQINIFHVRASPSGETFSIFSQISD
jgi:hypothetical protein